MFVSKMRNNCILTQVRCSFSDTSHLLDDKILTFVEEDFICRNHIHKAVDLQSGPYVVLLLTFTFKLNKKVEHISVNDFTNWEIDGLAEITN